MCGSQSESTSLITEAGGHKVAVPCGLTGCSALLLCAWSYRHLQPGLEGLTAIFLCLYLAFLWKKMDK